MNRLAAVPFFSLIALSLAACSQEHAPSESIGEAADTVVKEVDGSAPASRPKGEFAPRDECGDVEGAEAFRAQLADAVKARDAHRLLALAAPEVKLDFGGGSGSGELRSRLADPAQDLWSELEALMTLGCATNREGGITLPWYFEQDLGARDPMMSMIVLGEDVPAYATADPAAKPAGALSWAGVELVGGRMPDRARQEIRTAEGKKWFIATDKLRSVIDYRLSAVSRDGKWRITSLIAGD
jgi:hypothetical protein